MQQPLSRFFASAGLAAALTPSLGVAADPPAMPMPGPADSAPAGAQAMTAGEVRKVDKETNKITLRHGAIDNVGMPAMTMALAVRDPALLDAVKAGDKVRFRVEKDVSGVVVTAIETAR